MRCAEQATDDLNDMVGGSFPCLVLTVVIGLCSGAIATGVGAGAVSGIAALCERWCIEHVFYGAEY